MMKFLFAFVGVVSGLSQIPKPPARRPRPPPVHKNRRVAKHKKNGIDAVRVQHLKSRDLSKECLHNWTIDSNLGCGIHGCGYMVSNGNTKAVLKAFNAGNAMANNINFKSAYGTYHALSSRNGGYCPGVSRVLDICEKRPNADSTMKATNLKEVDGPNPPKKNMVEAEIVQRNPLDFPYVVFEYYGSKTVGDVYTAHSASPPRALFNEWLQYAYGTVAPCIAAQGIAPWDLQIRHILIDPTGEKIPQNRFVLYDLDGWFDLRWFGAEANDNMQKKTGLIQHMLSERLFARMLTKEERPLAYPNSTMAHPRQVFEQQILAGREERWMRLRYLAWKKFMHMRSLDANVWDFTNDEIFTEGDRIHEKYHDVFDMGWGDSLAHGGGYRGKKELTAIFAGGTSKLGKSMMEGMFQVLDGKTKEADEKQRRVIGDHQPLYMKDRVSEIPSPKRE